MQEIFTFFNKYKKESFISLGADYIKKQQSKSDIQINLFLLILPRSLLSTGPAPSVDTCKPGFATRDQPKPGNKSN